MQDLYAQRRELLLEDKPSPSMVFVFSGSAPMRSADETYPFTVNRNFYYLTGLDRENMVLVLFKGADGSYQESLYLEPYDEFLAKWVGGRMRPEEAADISGIDEIADLADLSDNVASAIDRFRGMGKFHVWLDLWRSNKSQSDTQAHRLAAWLRKKYPAVTIEDIYGDLAGLRAIKDDAELEIMAQAQTITKNAILTMLRHARPEMNESELEGAFQFGLMQQGCRELAFPTIVAGGPRATTLHYNANHCTVHDGELVLVDLGGTKDHYCADISRTFPINGKFTERQRQLYETVLEAQRITIETARPGMTMQELTEQVEEYYESRMDELGLGQNGETVDDYFYHSVTHSLGLDCHDAITLREYTLQPGMVITAEPGIYIEEEGIGIRIEDDILITEDGAIDLSADIPKTVEEIEAIMTE